MFHGHHDSPIRKLDRILFVNGPRPRKSRAGRPPLDRLRSGGDHRQVRRPLAPRALGAAGGPGRGWEVNSLILWAQTWFLSQHLVPTYEAIHTHVLDDDVIAVDARLSRPEYPFDDE